MTVSFSTSSSYCKTYLICIFAASGECMLRAVNGITKYNPILSVLVLQPSRPVIKLQPLPVPPLKPIAVMDGQRPQSDRSVLASTTHGSHNKTPHNIQTRILFYLVNFLCPVRVFKNVKESKELGAGSSPSLTVCLYQVADEDHLR